MHCARRRPQHGGGFNLRPRTCPLRLRCDLDRRTRRHQPADVVADRKQSWNAARLSRARAATYDSNRCSATVRLAAVVVSSTVFELLITE